MGEKVYELRKIKKKGRGMPLIGDKFPEMEVQTTHGPMELPDEFEADGSYSSATPQTSHLYAQPSSWPSRRSTRNYRNLTVNS